MQLVAYVTYQVHVLIFDSIIMRNKNTVHGAPILGFSKLVRACMLCFVFLFVNVVIKNRTVSRKKARDVA